MASNYRLSWLVVLVLEAWVSVCWASPSSPQKSEPQKVMPQRLVVDVSSGQGEVFAHWSWLSLEQAGMAQTRNGVKLLSDIAGLASDQQFIRLRNLLQGSIEVKPVVLPAASQSVAKQEPSRAYSWEQLDPVVDTLVRLGLKPVIELGFFGFKPSKGYDSWGELVRQWVNHSRERYGSKEVESWLWEPWNEPDGNSWRGTFSEFLDFYDYSVRAVKRACPRCKVGGPHIGNPENPAARATLNAFLEHCDSGVNAATGKRGAALDYVAFHAKAEARLTAQGLQMDLAGALRGVNAGFELVRSFPQFKDLPVLVGALEPDACKVCSSRSAREMAYSLGSRLPAYAAAAQERIHQLAQRHAVNLLGIEIARLGFDSQIASDLSLGSTLLGFHKPVVGLLKMLANLPRTERLVVQNQQGLLLDNILDWGVRGVTPEVEALATRDRDQIALLLWNYHDSSQRAEPRAIEVVLNNLAFEGVTVSHYRLGERLGNSRAAWSRMGFAQGLSAEQVAQLRAAEELQLWGLQEQLEPQAESLTLTFSVPRQAVSLVIVRRSRAE